MPAHPLPPREADVTRLLEELRSAVAALPIGSEITPIKLAYGGGIAPVHVLKQRVDDIIQQLQFLANYGSDEAMGALRDIGNHAAESLRTFLPAASLKKEELAKMPEFYPHPSVPGPVLLNLDMDGVKEILSREECLIRNSSREQILLRYRKIAPTSDIRIHVSMPPLIQYSETDYEVAGLGTAAAVSHSAARMRSLGAIHAIQEVVNKMVELRLSEILAPEMHNALYLTAVTSLVWPVPISAFEDQMREVDDFLRVLPLGQLLPFRLSRKGPGKNREVTSGSTALALEWATQLFLFQFEIGPLPAKARRKLNVVGSCKPADFCPLEIEGHTGVLRFEHRWQVKAALLPPFPASSKRSPAPREEEYLKKWRDAALLLAETECEGKWESHRWPRGITAKPGREMKDIIKAKLMVGLKALQPVK